MGNKGGIVTAVCLDGLDGLRVGWMDGWAGWAVDTACMGGRLTPQMQVRQGNPQIKHANNVRTTCEQHANNVCQSRASCVSSLRRGQIATTVLAWDI